VQPRACWAQPTCQVHQGDDLAGMFDILATGCIPELLVVQDVALAVQAQVVLANRAGPASGLLVVVLEHLGASPAGSQQHAGCSTSQRQGGVQPH